MWGIVMCLGIQCPEFIQLTMVMLRFRQGLLKLLWRVYSEGKLKSCLKLRNFQNPFNKDNSVGLEDIPCTIKGPKFALVAELASYILLISQY